MGRFTLAITMLATSKDLALLEWSHENVQELIVDQVFFVLGIKKSLLSMGQLHLHGYSTIFMDGTRKVVRSTELIARGNKRATLYWPLGPNSS